MTGQRSNRKCLAALLFAVLPIAPAFAACKVDSGTTRAALVELYTSEGCSSCPPADKVMHVLNTAGAQIVPLAMHVDYWDSIGWKDRFAQPAFTQRQQWEVQANAHRTSFTPHFFVNGREVQDWPADLGTKLRPATEPSTARIAIAAEPGSADTLHVRVDGTLVSGTDLHVPRNPLLFVVVTESQLSSQVDAGENRGVRLEHDAVARHWIGPIAFSGDHASLDRVLTVPELSRGHVSVVAFVQDARTAEVLQAADTGICKSS